MTLRTILTACFLAFAFCATAQVSINTTGADPDSSAMLDISSTNKGMLIPRMTTAERDAIDDPADGLLIYNVDDSVFHYFDKSFWRPISTSDNQNLTVNNDSLLISDGNGIALASFQKSLVPTTAQNCETKKMVDQSNTSKSVAGPFLWQSWTATYSGKFVSFEWHPRALFTLYSGVVKLYAGEGKKGQLLGQVSVTNTQSNSNTWITVYFDSLDINVEKDSIYTLLIDSNSGTFVWKYEPGNPYAGGRGSLGTDSDYSLRVYVDSCEDVSIFSPGTDSSWNFSAIDTLFFADGSSQSTAISDAQTLSISNDSISISNGNTISLESAFYSENGLTAATATSDDLLFGTEKLDHQSGTESKLLFNSNQSAFRVGQITNENWDTDSLGEASFAAGKNSIVTGDYSAAFGNDNAVYGENSTAFGKFNTASGNLSTVFGLNNEAPSYGETALGVYSSIYSPNATNNFSSKDRLLVVGNGANNNSRSDALVILKNGTTAINGPLTIDSVYTFPTEDGSQNQVMTTDGQGNASWQDLDGLGAKIEDDDGNSSVDVSTSDEVHITLGGTQYYTLKAGRMEVLNSGNSVFWGINAGQHDDLSNNINMAIGNYALQSNVTGEANVALGHSALSSSTGNFNLGIGQNAGGNCTGESNVFIGWNAGTSVTTGNGNVIIGNNAGGTSNVSGQLFIDNSSANSPLIHGNFSSNELPFNGDVGIGTAPSKAKLEIDGAGSSYFFPSFFGEYDINGRVTSSGSSTMSLYASNTIAASKFIAFSDARIKDIQGISDAQEDLQTILDIEITDYRLIDSVQHGNRPIKKVIAQQVAAVYPQAVSDDMTDVIPNIYQQAEISQGWISLTTDLKVGERVKIIFGDQSQTTEVEEVIENAFRVNLNHEGAVFVYGKEINDFHTVDYEALTTLNMSATQALAKQVEDLQVENAALRDQLSQLQAQQAEIDQLKAMLESLVEATN